MDADPQEMYECTGCGKELPAKEVKMCPVCGWIFCEECLCTYEIPHAKEDCPGELMIPPTKIVK